MPNSTDKPKDTFFTIKDLSIKEAQRFISKQDLQQYCIDIDAFIRTPDSFGIDNWKDAELRYSYSSEKVARLNGVSKPNEVLGKTDKHFIWGAGGYADIFEQEDREVLNGVSKTILGRYLSSKGKQTLLVEKIPVVKHHGEVIGVACRLTEIADTNLTILTANLANLNIEVTAEVIADIKRTILNDKYQYGGLDLTELEEETLYYLLRGLTASDIAKLLNKDLKNIKFNVDSLKAKFACKNQTNLIKKAIKMDCLQIIPMSILKQAQFINLKKQAPKPAAHKHIFGEITATLSHELNQPLTAIGNYISGCIRRLKAGNYQPEELLNAMQHCYVQTNRANELIQRIKGFIRNGTLHREMVNINYVINEAIKLVQHKLNAANIQLQLELNSTLPTILLDEIHMTQVILNLLNNAIEALQNKVNADPLIIIKTTLAGANFICVDVIDNGPGFSREVSSKILMPYFTTKESGMGIGLALCVAIVEAHGGHFIAKPDSSKQGAWFRFYLPVLKISAEVDNLPAMIA